jgi:hypothetical protein
MSDANPMPGRSEPPRETLWWRLLWMVIIGALMSLAQTLLGALAVIQLILMAVNKGKPNPEIAGFGKRLGPWLNRATRFQLGETESKPWPWAPLD